jgi:hypothetical protein
MLIRTDEQGPSGLGYLLIDNRNAPDVPFTMANRLMEADTYTCTHCQRVVVMNPERKRERYKCRGCNHHICDPCAAVRAAGAPCKTFAQVVDEELARVEKLTFTSVPPAIWP